MCPFYQTKPKVVQAIQCGNVTAEQIAAFTGASVVEFMKHRFVVIIPNGNRYVVYAGEWLVKDDHGNLSRMTDTDVHNLYSAVDSSLEHM